MRFVLASHNKGKLAEMQAILGELGVEVVMPSDVGVDVDVCRHVCLRARAAPPC